MSLSFSMEQFGDLLNYSTPTGTTSRYDFVLRSGVAATVEITINFNTIYSGSIDVTGVTGATIVSQTINQVVLSVALVPGDTPVSITANGQLFEPGNNPPIISMAAITLTGSMIQTGLSTVGVSNAAKVKSPQYGASAICLLGTLGTFAKTVFALSDPNVKGVWIAQTLPVPGMNVFLDQDMPPYVGAFSTDEYGTSEYGYALTAVSETLKALGSYFLDNPPTTQADNSSPVRVSSMRQQAILLNGDEIELVMGIPGYPDGYPFVLGPKYNLISESCQPQAAQWLLRRDTDFVPFDFGFNNTSTGYYTVQLATADPSNTRLSVNYYNSPVYSTVKSLKIRLVAAGSTKVGWKDGQFQYGDDLATMLKIYVNPNGSFPLTSCDFVTTNNEVTIDGTRSSDGGMHYLAALKAAGGINIAVQNLSGADVEYDLILEVDCAQNLQRQYFPGGSSSSPRTMECFSYVIDGTPPSTAGRIYCQKPVPQSGYCIFKVRATRMPVQNSAGISVTPSSGDEINVMLGQNLLQQDNTLSFAPFIQDIISPGAGDTGTGAGDTDMGAGGSGQPAMITIPADARDSGDVDVFIPVLAGNELVWQCDDDVIVEAWANWQPIFFSALYGLYRPNGDGGYIPAFDATAFQYCLAFSNWFSTSASNYSIEGTSDQTRVQFPPSIEIYNDLEACLGLI